MNTPMNQPFSSPELVRLRAEHGELMRRGAVMALGASLGLSQWKLRTLLDGDEAPLKPHPITREGVRWYARELVFVEMGLIPRSEALPSSGRSQG